MAVFDQLAVKIFQLRVWAKSPTYVADEQLKDQINDGLHYLCFVSYNHLVHNNNVINCETTLNNQKRWV